MNGTSSKDDQPASTGLVFEIDIGERDARPLHRPGDDA
jgi:hypothetical protein